MDNWFDVIVVGAGPGGSAAAVLLAQAGKKVLLVDKNGSAGGKMLVIHDREGFHYELFPINGVPAYNSRFEYVLKKIGKEDEVRMITSDFLGDPGVAIIEYADGEWRTTSLGDNMATLKATKVPLYNIAGLIKLGRVTSKLEKMPEEEMEKLSQISARDYLDSFGKLPGEFRTFLLASFCEGVFEMTYDKVSAYDLVRMYQVQRKGGAGRYYEQGLGHVFEVLADAVEEFGGKVLFKSRVANINVTDNQVRGLTLENGEKYHAPIIVSTAGIRQTVQKLVGEEKFPKQYVERIRNLTLNLACVGYRYFLDAPILKHPMTVIFPVGCLQTYEEFREVAEGLRKPEKQYVYVGTTSLYHNTAPKGKQLVYAVSSCYPRTDLNLKPYLEYIEKQIRRLYPDLYDHVERKEVMKPMQAVAVGVDSLSLGVGGESYGIANCVGQSGADRPSPVSPIEGLYFAGNDAGGFGLGTHQAVDSGVNVAELILSKLPL